MTWFVLQKNQWFRESGEVHSHARPARQVSSACILRGRLVRCLKERPGIADVSTVVNRRATL